uniref:Uncharacterized protein n=1 Tax=Knipowitschia caucasica TaxID=637954 RepID=A0AAV2LHZ1_KNICA
MVTSTAMTWSAVHGDTTIENTTAQPHSDHPVRFAFHRPPSTPASASSTTPRATSAKTYVSIYKGWIFLFDLQRSSEQTSLLNMLQKLHWLQ